MVPILSCVSKHKGPVTNAWPQNSLLRYLRACPKPALSACDLVFPGVDSASIVAAIAFSPTEPREFYIREEFFEYAGGMVLREKGYLVSPFYAMGGDLNAFKLPDLIQDLRDKKIIPNGGFLVEIALHEIFGDVEPREELTPVGIDTGMKSVNGLLLRFTPSMSDLNRSLYNLLKYFTLATFVRKSKSTRIFFPSNRLGYSCFHSAVLGRGG